MITTRKRAAAAADQPLADANPKRSRTTRSSAGASSPARGSPQGRSPGEPPAPTPAKQRPTSVPKKGSRGAAFLAAAGIVAPVVQQLPSPPRLSTKKESAVKAARRAAEEAAAPASAPRPSGTPIRNPLLRQELPRKLNALLDMFAGLQTVYEVMRKRGQRTTYQNIRQAVEEASGRRFLLPHVAQLMHLLPEALSLEWVRLPVAAHSSRTEPHLLINLDFAAAGEAALACGAARPGSELQAVRALLQCRLAGHLVGSYREHLAARASEARAVGDEAAAEELEAAAAAAADPPVTQWVPPYPEDAADVPEQQLPQRPDAASRGGSPAVLTGYAAAPGAHLALPSTPATGVSKLPPSTTGGRQGRPPMHPNTVDRQRVMHRRLSFGAAAAAAAAGEGGGAAPAATPSRAALAAAAGLASGCAAKPRTPLDKLASQLEVEAAANAQVHASQADLAASLAGEPGGLEWGASIPMSQEDASLLASMPEELRRMSTDGIISMDTLRKLDAAEQQHRRLSSKEAVEARDVSAALGQLPRTFSRLQRIFGFQGPKALKLQDVIARVKQGAETSSEAQIEAQLRALAEHAPEYVTVKAYGACGTPALWVDRGANANALMARLREVAGGRHAARGM